MHEFITVTLRRWAPFLAAVATITGFVLTLAFAFHVNPPKTPEPDQTVAAPVIVLEENLPAKLIQPPEKVVAALPVRLRISTIGVNAVIESVGLTAQGAVGVPTGRSNTAWFNLGPLPGTVGSSVIDGHFGTWKDGTPAVFNDLHKLQKGDTVTVEDSNGGVTTFVVRELRSFNQTQDASDVFYSTDGKAHLNLVTCEGAWNSTLKNYPDRLVVFTDKQN